MQLVMNHASTSAAWAEALFASVLQRSGRPSPGQVRKAVAAAVRAHGGPGCAGLVAQAFGDHPETAVQRMRWARAAAGEAFAPLPGPARGSGRRPAGAARRWPAATAAAEDMKRIRAGKPEDPPGAAPGGGSPG